MRFDLVKAIALAEMRIGKKLTWTEVASLTGVSRETLNKIKKDELQQVRMETIEKIIRGLQVPPNDLMEFTPPLDFMGVIE